MSKRLIGAAALALVAAVPTQASAAVPKPLRAEYQHHYNEVAKRHGDRAPGCNLFRTCKGKPTAARVRRSNATLERMLYVPKPVTTTARSSWGRTGTATAVTTTAPATSSPPAAGGGLPSCSWAPESGGDYNAYNPSSGASGKYQVIPSTHAAYCSDLSQSPADQEECAGRIYEGQGAGAWVNC